MRTNRIVRETKSREKIICVQSGGSTGTFSPPPAFTPSLDFSDSRNSQYLGAGVGVT